MVNEHPLVKLVNEGHEPDRPRLVHGRFGMGWKPDLPHKEDQYKRLPVRAGQLPAHTDLRKTFEFPLFDQGQLGSCTANGIAALLKFRMGVLNKSNPQVEVITPSRLQIYYHERFMEHTIQEDAGAQIRDGIQALLNWGFCREEHWPYDINQFRHRPPLATYQESAKLRVADHYRVEQTHEQIVAHLAQDEPVVYGFTVYESFESDQVAKTGMVPMPQPGERTLGGHCVTIWGHDDANSMYLCRNSWGNGWGQGGYFCMPFAFIHDQQLCDDFWSVRLVP